MDEMPFQQELDLRSCPGCGVLKDRWEMEEIYDDQGIYAGLYCSYECCERRGKIRLHRSYEEAVTAGDWGDDGNY